VILRRLAASLVTALALTLAACSAPGVRVILLPEADGRLSAVVVDAKDGQVTLSEPYQRATAGAREHGAPIVDKVSLGQVQAENKELFALMPPPAQHFTLHFEAGTTKLAAESERILEDALKAALARNGGDIVITGHTDTVGTTAQNDELSRDRAAIVRQQFINRGFAPTRVEAVGRGKRELAIPTADEVVEPRNRRVTIDVR
jgi:outer membrane protein OmpA-like peptidoglycan-associated protein